VNTSGLYAYAITRGLDAAAVAEQSGIGGQPVRLVEREGLAVVVSEVDLEQFGEEGLRRNLEDLAWLETVALAHDDVARFSAARAPTAPLRLATVFLGEDSVRAQLAEWHEQAQRALDRIEGRTEWSVKAYSDPSARPATAPTSSDSSGGGATGEGAGTAYLMQRRAATQRREQTAQEDARIAEQLHTELARLATMSQRLAPQDPRLSGYSGVMILNGTYLLDDAQVERFTQTAVELGDRHAHIRLEVGGPWPPYSFSSLDAS
jgi:hypothetical protein